MEITPRFEHLNMYDSFLYRRQDCREPGDEKQHLTSGEMLERVAHLLSTHSTDEVRNYIWYLCS